MSIDLNWEAITTGPDGDALAGQIRDFIHSKFQAVPLPRFIKSVVVHEFQFGTVAPELELRDITDPLPDFYEDGSSSGESGSSSGDEEEEEEEHQGHHHHHVGGQRHGHQQQAQRELQDLTSPFLGVSTPGILGGAASSLHYFGSHLGNGGSQTPLAAVAAHHRGLWHESAVAGVDSSKDDEGTASSAPSPLPTSTVSTPGLGGMSGMSRPGSSYLRSPGLMMPMPMAGGPMGPLYRVPPSSHGDSVSSSPGPSVMANPSTPEPTTTTVSSRPGSRGRRRSNDAATSSKPKSKPKTTNMRKSTPNSKNSDSAILSDDSDDENVHAKDSRPEDVQAVFRIHYAGDVRLNLTAEILLDYPMPSFVNIPVRLSITGMTFDGVGVVAHIRKRVHFCFLSPEDAVDAVGKMGDGDGGDGKTKFGGLLQEIKVESEIGLRDGGKQSLRNVGKVEKFVLEQVRRIFEDEFVYPSFWTFLV